jgi:hypothetical protein
MATKWNTVKFIQAWAHGTLNRKRVHGTYRVLDGDHCKILVRASTNYGRPEGSTLIGINLSTEEHKACFFHHYNTNAFTYRMTKDLDVYNAPKLPSDVLNGDDHAILDSGIIDTDDEMILIELGDKPYLLHRKLNESGNRVRWEGQPKFEALDKIPKRVASIKEAQELVKEPTDMTQLCHAWWAEKQPDTFKPPNLEDEYIKALSKPINPLDYGFGLDDCVITESSYGDTKLGMLVPGATLLEAPLSQQARDYIIARDCWNLACEKVKIRTPLEYKKLSTKKSRYSYHSQSNDRVGYIVCTTAGVFIKGVVHGTENWEDKTRLDNWHRLYAQVNRIKL